MLVYVFWHRPRPEIDINSYLDRLKTFHHTLAQNKPEGLLYSKVFSMASVPWLDGDGLAFEDRHFLNNSAALDHLNSGAVSGPCEEPHNLVARDAAVGTAGLYQLHSGQEASPAVSFATWFSKPSGLSYADLRSLFEPTTSFPGIGLWQRQMTLGPTTEFCLCSPTRMDLPGGFEATTLQMELVWASEG